MTVLTYVYEARPPLEGGDRLAEQMRLAHRYRNDLAALERERRQRNEQLLRDRCPDLVEADRLVEQQQGALDALLRETKRTNAQARSRVSAGDDSLRQRLREARRYVREARARQKELRKGLYADGSYEVELKAINRECHDRSRQLRADSELYWGTYQLIEEAAAEFHKGAPPSFWRWGRPVSVAVHFQGEPVTVEDVLEGTTQARLFVPDDVPTKAVLSLRVGSVKEEGRRPEPVWCVVPFTSHRPVPAGALVKWVRLKRLRIGTQTRWEAHFVVSLQDSEDGPTVPEGMVAVDVGWRLMPDRSLRIAYWFGSDNRSGELRLSADLVREDALPDRLRGIRDQHFDGARAVLAAWLAGRDAPAYIGSHLDWLGKELSQADRDASRGGGKRRWRKRRLAALTQLNREIAAWQGLRDGWRSAAVPDWLRERTESLSQWRSAARLAALLIHWRRPENRFEGDGPILEALEAWRRRDRHLCDWEAFTRLHVQRVRLDVQRKFASMLAREYGQVVVENVNWRELLERPDVDEETDRGARRHARLASPGKLVAVLREEFSGRFLRVPPEETTQRCHVCEGLCEWDQARDLEHTCEHCGVSWDQDFNASRNLLARGEVVNDTTGAARDPQPSTDTDVTTAQRKGSRRNRRSKREPLAADDAITGGMSG